MRSMKYYRIPLLLLGMLGLLLTGCQTAPPLEESVAYSFQVEQTVIAVDAPAKVILDALGPWSNYAESPSCAFEGMDKVYTYAGFEIETYCLGGGDYIAAIHLLDDSVATQKGIRIGSSAQEVLNAYGTPTSQNDTSIVYSAKGMKLQFLLRGGAVTNIQYLKTT